MSERFVRNTGTISIGTGDSTVVGTSTTFAGHDLAGAKLYACPNPGVQICVGTIAEVDPRGVYENLSLPLVSPYRGDPLTNVAYELVDGVAIAVGASEAAVFARFAAHLEQKMGLVGNLADDIDYSLVPNNSLFIDDVTRAIYQWRDGVLTQVYSIGLSFSPRGAWDSGTTYAKNDLIEDGGYVFVSNVDMNLNHAPNTAPASSSYWTYMQIVSGSPGADGADGAPGSSNVTGTSTSSVAVATGSKNFTIVETARGWAVGARLRISSNANGANFMEGVATAYSGTALTVSVDLIGGSGTHIDWTINLAGQPGEQGVAGNDGADGAAGTTGSPGAPGADGANAYVYIAYASDASGSDFTTTFDAALNYIAILSTVTEIVSPSAGDFSGLWKNYKGVQGDQGVPGADGSNGADGADGSPGALWYEGAIDPDNGNGINGDFYLQTGAGATGVLGDVWEKAGGSWSIVTNIRGPAGAGSGDVLAPVSATANNFASFDSTPTQLKDSGKNAGSFIASGYLDTDTALAANSDAKIASQKAVKAYIDALLGANDAMVFKGVIDCSSNPNYPAADAGHVYSVSVAGKIGGASGINVEVQDSLLCIADATASGTQAAVGTYWAIRQGNIDGAVIGPAGVSDGRLVLFDGTTGRLIKQGTGVPGDAAYKNTGTSAGTLAAGDDSRITGALQASGGTLTGAVNFPAAVDVASATPNIGAAAGNYVNITGTTTITAFDTVAAGQIRWCKFAGALTLIYNATSLILPGSANIVTAAGDSALFISEGSGNWRCLSYIKRNGAALLSYLLPGTTATITVGYAVTPYNLGNITSFTIDPALGNYQYGTNHAAATWTAPASDCAVDIYVVNDGSAGTITFSGFTVGSSTGDALTTTNGNKFIISIRRINSVSTYIIKALQ